MYIISFALSVLGIITIKCINDSNKLDYTETFKWYHNDSFFRSISSINIRI